MASISVLAPFIFSFEGGFVNDPRDAGGATNRGVTIATFKAYGRDYNGDGKKDVADLKALTLADATEIMRRAYWNLWRADEISSQSVANLLVDWVWASGPATIKTVQSLLGVTADGIVGPKTLAALNACNANALFDTVKQRRRAFIDSICKSRPANMAFRNGWLRRLDSIRFGSLVYNNGSLHTHAQ